MKQPDIDELPGFAELFKKTLDAIPLEERLRGITPEERVTGLTPDQLILALPLVTRTSEEVLRTVPDGLREASLALGAPQWRVVMRVVLPTARAGLVTAVLLAVARITGETAPVLLTAFTSATTNTNPFSGTQSSLPSFVYDLIRVPNQTQNDRAWAGALLLLIIVLIAFAAARITLARSERKLGRR